MGGLRGRRHHRQHSYPVPSLQSNPLNERVAVCGEYGGITLKVEGHLWKGNDMEYTSVADSKALAERFNAYTVALQGLQEQGIWHPYIRRRATWSKN